VPTFEELALLKSSVERSIGNWEKSLQVMQAQAQSTFDAGKSIFVRNDAWANSPMGPPGPRIEGVQNWLDKARDAVESGDHFSLRAAANTARNAWRPVASAVESAGTQVVPVLESAAESVTPTLPRVAATVEASVPAFESMAPAAQSVIQPLVAAGEQTLATVEQNPVVVPLAVAAGRAAVVGGARGVFGGWVGVAVGAALAAALAVGAYAWSNSGSGSSGPSEAVSAQAPVPAPVPAPEPPPPPPQNLLGSGEQTPPAAVVPTPNPEPPPVQTPPAPRPQPQAPTPQPQPAPAPTPQCTYPNSIGVQGGSGSLGPQGGSFTVTDPNVVLSTGGLVNCGKHYQLGFSDGSASGYDCKTSGFNYNISNSVKVGDSVSVAFRLPPNSCN
jgi:hypothetical protein